MKVDTNKLLNKIEITNKTELAKAIGIVRCGLYYHLKKLKNGKLTFKNEMIKKIGLFIYDDENGFFI